MKNIILVVLALSVFGCTKEPAKPNPIQDVACSLSKIFAKNLVAKVSGKFACAHPEEIQKDVDAVLIKVKLCAAPVGLFEAKAVNPMCGVIVDTLAEMAFSEGVPAKYGCTGGAGKAEVVAFVKQICGASL